LRGSSREPFPASYGAIGDWLTFHWHRDSTGRIQAHKAQSSQAIAIDPFAGDAYQWMRNAVLATAIGEHGNLQAAAVAAFADHPSFPTAPKAKLGLLDPSFCNGQAAITRVSDQEIITLAHQVGLNQQLWAGFSAWKIVRAPSRFLRASPLPTDQP
jgi:hypothetical protein